MYRGTITEIEYKTYENVDASSDDYENVDASSEDYETACSESSFVTCVSRSLSLESDLDNIETMSSSSSDTVVDEVFMTSEEVHLINLAGRQLRTDYICHSKVQWNADAEKLIQNYERT